jgi:hypothetical protein
MGDHQTCDRRDLVGNRGVLQHLVRQGAAGHADPRTTRRYDRARHNLHRHPAYVVAGLVGCTGTRTVGPVDRWQVFKVAGTVEKVAPVIRAILRSKIEVESLTLENDGQIIVALTWPGLRSSFGERIRVELSQSSGDVVDLQTSSESRELFDLGLHKRNLHWIETGLSEEGILIDAGPVKRQMRRG